MNVSRPIASDPVLVVDDDAVVCEVLTHLLQALGYSAICAPTADTGRLALQSGPRWRALMIDKGIESDGGLRLLTRAASEHPHAIPILITGGSVDPIAAAAFQGLRVLHKPFTLAELRSVLTTESSSAAS
ncbi:MAG: response regulator [Planctomycetes bacterium]|nr:response regulator [Planctomycetota bacterium]